MHLIRIRFSLSDCRRFLRCCFFLFLASGTPFLCGQDLPEFTQGTVMVFRSVTRGYEYNFVLRIAQFRPGCYFEWEGQSNQGTVYLKPQAVEEARKYNSQRLFQNGIDAESAEETTYWFSRALLSEVKQKRKASIFLDSLKTQISLVAEETFTLSVNQKKVSLSAVVLKDGRGGQWWILDNPDNPLVLQRKINSFTESLASIDTTRADTLRWIKGRKLKQYAP